ncbi:uncharacterized protein FIBRA_06755 [Fibroporia radiculosa]|uniref:Endonuclease III homolog n=1 Tax=Fibroporia radiculosa TaxID=599839 RepID=J4H489_9APHY|nr:uncharacterized protein FIBRA_06755 [Fibroporia radiculosa]CCM04574.1 predicted protein [Fibroporia radiculosa]
MSVRKRSQSPVLIGRPSAHHPSVTLFDTIAVEVAGYETNPRRSKRGRFSNTTYKEESDEDEKPTASSSLAPRRRLSEPSTRRATERGSKRKSTNLKKTDGRSDFLRKIKPIPQTLDVPHPAPSRWQETYDAIKDMRSRTVAPVDTMGCGRAQLGETIPKNQRFATLVSLMLSSQTKDEVTSAAVEKLREAVGGSLSVEAVLRADDHIISDAICKVGFWRRKTQYIKRTTQRLHDDFDSDVPKTVDELCSLPGVGPKMAFLALHVAWKVNAGIGVDVHVHRITNRLGWHAPPTKNPEETRLNLQSWLPTELRPTFTGLLVGFGQPDTMPVLKRSASPLDPMHIVASHTTVRRSKRLKLTTKCEDEASDTLITVDGSSSVIKKEDTVSGIDKVKVHRRSTKRTGTASPRKQKPIQQALDVPHPTPPRWREVYDTIKDMRSRKVAPVDTMGCNRAQDEETVPQNRRFATLISLMLSSQTKDETTFAAVTKLREVVGGALSVEAILNADDSVISEAICKVGFWRRKTQYIKQTAEQLRDRFDSDVPKTVDELCSLPGVGPKMAFLALQDAWKLNAGIGVDVHVHRITNRLGWHKPQTKTPEETRLNLQSWLPLELHPEINSLLVGFGQTICMPVGPKCNDCSLREGLCPSARTVKSKSRSRGVVAEVAGSLSGPKVEIGIEPEVKIELSDTTVRLEENTSRSQLE